MTENSAVHPVRMAALAALSQEHIADGVGQQWSIPFHTTIMALVLEVTGAGRTVPNLLRSWTGSAHVALEQL
jgi:hypothetical protein